MSRAQTLVRVALIVLTAVGVACLAVAQTPYYGCRGRACPAQGNASLAPTKSAKQPGSKSRAAVAPATPAKTAFVPYGPPAPTGVAPQPKPAATQTGVLVPIVNYPLAAVSALAYSPDGKQVALGSFGQVVLYDTATWKPTATFRNVLDTVRSLSFSPDSKTVAIGCGLPSRNGEAILWHPGESGAGRIFVGQKDAVEAIAFSRDGKQLLLGADDNTARWYQDHDSFQYTNLDEHNGRVQAVAISPKNGWVFVTGAGDHLVKVWDPRTRHTVINFDQSESGISGLAFLNNGDQFVGASLDGKLYWWGIGYDKKRDTFGGYLFRVEMAHPDGVYGFAMSADGNRLITCGADNTVGVWNANGGRIRTFREADRPLYAVALSPDGKSAVGGGRAGLLYVWDVESSKLLTIVAPPPLTQPRRMQTTAAHLSSGSR